MGVAPPLSSPPFVPQQPRVALPPIIPQPRPVATVPTVPPPAVQARERKNAKTDVKRKEGTALRQVVKNASPPPPPPQKVDPNAPPQMANPQFTPAQYEAPKMNALRYIAAGLGLLFGGSPLGGAGASFLTGQNQKAKDTYTRQESQAEQQYNVAEQQAKVNYDNAKMVWDNNVDVRARGLNPLKKNPDGSYAPFQYPTPQQIGAKAGDFTSEIQAYDQLQQLAARNGDKAGMDRFSNDQSILLKQQQDAQTWEKFIITQREEDARSAASQAGQDRRETSRENREDARANLRLTTDQNKPLTAMQRIDLTTKADAAGREFQKSYAFLTQPHVTQGGVTVQPSMKASLIPRLNGILGYIRLSKDPQGLAQHLSSLTKDTNAQQLIQQYGDSMALQRQARGQEISPQSYANVPDSADEKLQALYVKAQTHGLDVTKPEVIKAIMHDAGMDEGGGSNAAPNFPG